MKDQTVEFKTAKLAAEKGFPQPKRYSESESTYPHYKGEQITIYNYDAASDDLENTGQYAKPTQSVLQKWLRDKYDIDVLPNRLSNDFRAHLKKNGIKDAKYMCNIFKDGEKVTHYGDDVFENVFEMGLREALNHITKVKSN